MKGFPKSLNFSYQDDQEEPSIPQVSRYGNLVRPFPFINVMNVRYVANQHCLPLPENPILPDCLPISIPDRFSCKELQMAESRDYQGFTPRSLDR